MSHEILKHLVLYAKGYYQVKSHTSGGFMLQNVKIIQAIINNIQLIGGDTLDKSGILKTVLNQLDIVNDNGLSKQQLINAMCEVLGGYSLGHGNDVDDYGKVTSSLYYILKYLPTEELPFNIRDAELSNVLYDIIKSI